jgi:hypothetical protein
MLDSTGSVVLVGMLAATAARPCCRLSRVIFSFMKPSPECAVYFHSKGDFFYRDIYIQ